MVLTPPKKFFDDDDIGYGKTPEPRRQRLDNLERKVEVLCREKGSLVVSSLIDCPVVGKIRANVCAEEAGRRDEAL